jgi:hypothetical protein
MKKLTFKEKVIDFLTYAYIAAVAVIALSIIFLVGFLFYKAFLIAFNR